MPDLVGNPEFMFSHDTAQRYVFFLKIFNEMFLILQTKMHTYMFAWIAYDQMFIYFVQKNLNFFQTKQMYLQQREFLIKGDHSVGSRGRRKKSSHHAVPCSRQPKHLRKASLLMLVELI